MKCNFPHLHIKNSLFSSLFCLLMFKINNNSILMSHKNHLPNPSVPQTTKAFNLKNHFHKIFNILIKILI